LALWKGKHSQLPFLRSLAAPSLQPGLDSEAIPANIVFIQGDIFELPFKHQVFGAVASFGVLHIFDEKLKLLSELERVKCDGGNIFFSSLVGNNGIGRKYLEILRQAGEVATCYSSEPLGSFISNLPFKYELTSIGNMAYAKSAPIRQRD
jgi:ubiquinone/menaquinone biosynthesis C-methylase UbiE